MHTLTQILRAQIKADKTSVTPAAVGEAPEIEKGRIFYSYRTEVNDKDGNPIYNYFDITGDLIESFQDNKSIQDMVTEVINDLSGDGSNVYFGPVKDGSDDNVLYVYDKDTDTKTEINIEANIIDAIKDDKKVIESILKAAAVRTVTDGIDVYTKVVFMGERVFKGFRTIEVDDVGSSGGATGPKAPITVNPGYFDENGNPVKHDQDLNMGRIISVRVLDIHNMVVFEDGTDIVKIDDLVFSMRFGSNNMYQNLPKGKYKLEFEYTSTASSK